MELLFKADIVEKFIKKASEIIENHPGKQVGIIGIKTGGFLLAKRIFTEVVKDTSKNILLGSLDITFWRDDLSHNPYPIVKGTEINFSTDDLTVFLIDDVIYTGRTIRSALCEIFDFGRPECVKLLTLVNRIGRELPIHPDYFAFLIEVDREKSVEVILKEKGFPIDCGIAITKGEKITPLAIEIITSEKFNQ